MEFKSVIKAAAKLLALCRNKILITLGIAAMPCHLAFAADLEANPQDKVSTLLFVRALSESLEDKIVNTIAEGIINGISAQINEPLNRIDIEARSFEELVSELAQLSPSILVTHLVILAHGSSRQPSMFSSKTKADLPTMFFGNTSVRLGISSSVSIPFSDSPKIYLHSCGVLHKDDLHTEKANEIREFFRLKTGDFFGYHLPINVFAAFPPNPLLSAYWYENLGFFLRPAFEATGVAGSEISGRISSAWLTSTYPNKVLFSIPLILAYYIRVLPTYRFSSAAWLILSVVSSVAQLLPQWLEISQQYDDFYAGMPFFSDISGFHVRVDESHITSVERMLPEKFIREVFSGRGTGIAPGV